MRWLHRCSQLCLHGSHWSGSWFFRLLLRFGLEVAHSSCRGACRATGSTAGTGAATRATRTGRTSATCGTTTTSARAAGGSGRRLAFRALGRRAGSSTRGSRTTVLLTFRGRCRRRMLRRRRRWRRWWWWFLVNRYRRKWLWWWLWRVLCSRKLLFLLFLPALLQRHQCRRHGRSSGLGRFLGAHTLEEVFRNIHVVTSHGGHGSEDVFLLGLVGPWVAIVDAANTFSPMLAERRLAAQLALVDADGRSPDVAILDQGLFGWLAALMLRLAAQRAS